MSEEQYRELVRSTIPPAPPVPRLPEDPGKAIERVLNACYHMIERTFSGRAIQLRTVRSSGSLTVILQGPAQDSLGRVVVSKRFGKEIYNVWVQHPPSGTSNCADMARRIDVAFLLDELQDRLKKLTGG
jgi:hypothetical protein